MPHVFVAENEFAPINAGAEVKIKPQVPYKIITKNDNHCIIEISGKQYTLNSDEVKKGKISEIKTQVKPEASQAQTEPTSIHEPDIHGDAVPSLQVSNRAGEIVFQLNELKRKIESRCEMLQLLAEEEHVQKDLPNPQFERNEIARMTSGEKIQVLGSFYKADEWHYVVIKFHELLSIVPESKMKK